MTESNAENVKYIFDKVFIDNFMSHTPIVVLANQLKFAYINMQKLNVNIQIEDLKSEFILKVITFYTPENIEKEYKTMTKILPKINSEKINNQLHSIIKGLEKYVVHNSLKQFM